MSYIALYRKWRPLKFEDVVEQEHVVKTLKNTISADRIAHAYLFCGTRGTGKTTMAKIFSRAINCLSPKEGNPCNECEICKGILTDTILDVVEIDAASNNSVDNIREIRDEVVYAPSQARYKVYIIDEVHMLSTGAFNALLKTLEEPPGHVVFILATTEPHKLPATILSRCQRFDFRRITAESIKDRLVYIAGQSGVSIKVDAAKLIAKMAEGALRDAISILDQCISLGNSEISYDDVLSVVGMVNDEFLTQVSEAVQKKDINEVLNLIEKLVMDGKDIAKFVSDMVFYYRNMLICKIAENPQDIIGASGDYIEIVKSQCKPIDKDEIIYIIKELSRLESAIKWGNHPRILLEVALIKICQMDFTVNKDNILDRLDILEKKISNGNIEVKMPAQGYSVREEKSTPQKRSPAKEYKKPAPAKTSGGEIKKGSFNNFEEWEKVLNELKGLGRMALYTNLIDTKAIDSGNIISIVFGEGSSFKKMIVSKIENLEVISDAIKRIAGRDVKVKCINEDDLYDNSEVVYDNNQDELVDKAKEIAAKFDVPLNIIDE